MALDPDSRTVKGHDCSPDGWDQTQPWEDCSLPGGLLCAGKSVCEGGDSCFVSQEKLKSQYLKEIPGKMKLYSEFLGRRPWFAGDKVSGMALGEGELSLS